MTTAPRGNRIENRGHASTNRVNKALPVFRRPGRAEKNADGRTRAACTHDNMFGPLTVHFDFRGRLKSRIEIENVYYVLKKTRLLVCSRNNKQNTVRRVLYIYHRAWLKRPVQNVREIFTTTR